MRSWLLQVMCCTVALTAFVATGVHADDYNKKTYITFSASVQLPGVTLPAGTYTFKLADPPADVGSSRSGTRRSRISTRRS